MAGIDISLTGNLGVRLLVRDVAALARTPLALSADVTTKYVAAEIPSIIDETPTALGKFMYVNRMALQASRTRDGLRPIIHRNGMTMSRMIGLCNPRWVY